MPAFLRLSTEADFQEAERRSFGEPVLLFKHSRTCPVSAWARQRLSRLAGEDQLPVYEVIVQQSRALSAGIAQSYGIRHESPQVILLHEGTPIHHASHSGIVPEEIARLAAEAMGKTA